MDHVALNNNQFATIYSLALRQERADGWTDRWMADGWRGGWVGRWIGGWPWDGWMDGQVGGLGCLSEGVSVCLSAWKNGQKDKWDRRDRQTASPPVFLPACVSQYCFQSVSLYVPVYLSAFLCLVVCAHPSLPVCLFLSVCPFLILSCSCSSAVNRFLLGDSEFIKDPDRVEELQCSDHPLDK